MMRKMIVMLLASALVVPLSTLEAAANCIPPWQTLFACNIPRQDARAEFCLIPDTDAHPGKKQGYYTYVVGTKPAELYFEADGYYFSTKDTLVDHPTDLTMAIGFKRGAYVYSFTITEDRQIDGRVRDGEVRVYSSLDAFTSSEKDTEVTRLYCDRASILADTDNIRP
ncbi:hypothetical protein JYU29_00585 [Tianweitania sp. BSSL-BM11]|uniref:Uncharacterized protein n=1 Tax=Tianweitania aestuarii TaxID=2814886 RepID=A0ABS5RQ63_9HYPH|nr:hypothetical protein [Tianweitania aestuarii]MBS9719178.1 hypothetical protein [Tianweitania aestuarii]